MRSPFRHLAAPKRVDPTNSLAPALRDSFLKCVSDGDIDAMRQLLENQPLLVQVRNRDRAAVLLLASVHSNSHKAVEMIDLLMKNGAVLGSRDIRKRNVLLYACAHGVDWEIVACLMKWNNLLGKGILKWSHCDDQKLSSLALACAGRHTRLALRLLDEIDIEEHAMQNHPFHILEVTIGTGDELHAMEITEHPKIQLAFDDTTVLRYKGYCGFILKHTVYTCAEAAILQGMSDVLLLLNDLNHRRVCKATWYTTCIHRTFNETNQCAEDIHPVILAIADQFLVDWRWAQIKHIFLIRFRAQGSKESTLQSHCLVQLPDHMFRLVVEFIKPKEFYKIAATTFTGILRVRRCHRRRLLLAQISSRQKRLLHRFK